MAEEYVPCGIESASERFMKAVNCDGWGDYIVTVTVHKGKLSNLRAFNVETGEFDHQFDYIGSWEPKGGAGE